ncbi:hypothetical protein GCK72_005831 [Caenorhabditis remanei]|uniref:F-box associated domain-containing protein n=1 Tax=Caenorhabditis remanei TaxID=31234 RepID=A0A6A5HDP2_CAERE|nr:hypothetical protein GCK72_005831 [Caenorhabditis remanei]KAF1765878.1 hypothetical protein GCK72_005831 [Caenorhabditis remanei]
MSFRSQLSRIDPQFRNLHNWLKMNFESFVISDGSPKSQVIIGGKYIWNIQEDSPESSVVWREREQVVTKKYYFNLSRYELLRKLVEFYLNRSGTTIRYLDITNHPYGLELCEPLKVHHLKWKLSICSSRYDYTTWFNCLRFHPIEKVEIDLDGEDNTVLSEDVISSAWELCIKTRIPLPIQAIMSFKFKVLSVNQEISSEEVLKLCERWIYEKRTIGTRITFEKSENQDLESIESILKEKYLVNQKTSKYGGIVLEIQQNNVKLQIYEIETVKFSIEVIE